MIEGRATQVVCSSVASIPIKEALWTANLAVRVSASMGYVQYIIFFPFIHFSGVGWCALPFVCSCEQSSFGTQKGQP